MIRRGAFRLGLLLSCCPAAVAAECPLEAGPGVQVSRVVDGETLELADGRQVRLINFLPPHRPLWLDTARPWPAETRTVEALALLVAGKEVMLAFDGRREDRRRRLMAQVFVLRDGGKLWVQGDLVGRGLGRVRSLVTTRTCAAALLALENKARQAATGIWSDAFYRVRKATPAEELPKLKNTFAIVEGKVLRMAEVGSRIFLNFEEQWRRDFTVVIARQSARLFAGADEETADSAEKGLESLAGARIRVRGWMKIFNGPMIDVTHPEQIERLDD